MKTTLNGLQLKEWAKYEKQIQCSTVFLNEGEDPEQLIDKVFQNVKLIEGTKAIVDDETLLDYVDPIW